MSGVLSSGRAFRCSRREIVRMKVLVSVSCVVLCLVGLVPHSGHCDDQTYTTTVLPNGMRVVLRENHDNPLIASLVYVNAGSAYEHSWNNGVSHLLEHLLFDGTRERSREDINEGVKDLGGYINAFTRDLYTAFILLVPSENIEEGLDLQQDMLFNSIIPVEELEKERKVVIEEIRKDEGSPYYQAERFHREKLFAGTPYALPIIGYPNVISTITREEIMEYYRSHFVPNNMLVLVMGDFEEETMLDRLEASFGSVSSQSLPLHADLELPPPEDNAVFVKRGDTGMTYGTVSYICPPPHHKDFNAVHLLSRYLARGEDSPLMRGLVRAREPVATSVFTSFSLKEGFSVLDITIMSREEDHLKILNRLRGTLRQVSHIEPEKERLEELKTGIVVSDIITEEKFHYFGIMMADDIAVGGVDNLMRRRKVLPDVSPDDIVQAASQYLDAGSYIATFFLPEKPEAAVETEARGETSEHFTLSNGLDLTIESSGGSDVFAVNVLAQGRAALEPVDRPGLAGFLSRMLERGTTTRNYEQLASDLRSIGAELTVVDNPMIPYDDRYTSPAYSFVRFQTLGRYHEKAIEILADIIRNPAFEEHEIGLVAEELVGLITASGRSSYKVGRMLFRETLFEDHPFSRPLLGTMESVSLVTRDDLSDLHSRLYTPRNLVVTVVTDLPAEEVRSRIEEAFGGEWGTGEEFDGFSAPPPLSEKRERIEEQDMKQAYLYVGYLLPGAGHPDVPKIIAMNSILSARLGLTLREKEGLAYSVGSSVRFDREFGYLGISMGTAPESTDRAKQGILEQVELIMTRPVGETELSRAVSDYRGDLLRNRMSRLNRGYYLARDEYLGREGEDEIYKEIRALTADDILEAARRYFSTEIYALAMVK